MSGITPATLVRVGAFIFFANVNEGTPFDTIDTASRVATALAAAVTPQDNASP